MQKMPQAFPSPGLTVPALPAIACKRSGPSLDSIQYIHDSLVLGSSELNTVLNTEHRCGLTVLVVSGGCSSRLLPASVEEHSRASDCLTA